jgi:hypothetical protein
MANPLVQQHVSTPGGFTVEQPLTSTQDTESVIRISPATQLVIGAVKPDNTTITVSPNGTISATGAGLGTVTSVALTMPTEFSVSGSPVTTAGTLAVTKANQAANQVYAGPATGAAAPPGFRALVAADLPAGTVNPIGGVNSQTGNYNVLAADDGKIISVTSAATATVTLPNPAPSATFKIFVQNLGAGLVHINANGLTLDTVTGNALNMTGGASQGVYISSDGTNYFSSRGKIGPATSTVIGSVIPDGTIITVSASGAITVPKASSSVFGVVEVDGTTITSAAGVISAVGGGGGLVQSVTLTLTNLQILTLGTVPVEFVAPPGAGKLVSFLYAVFENKSGGTNYTGGDNLQFFYENGAFPFASGTIPPNLLTGNSVASMTYMAATTLSASNGYPTNNIVNQGLILSTGSGANFATGTGTLQVTVFYTVTSGW